MFRRTSPQVSLLESHFLLPPSKRARLERSWAHIFNGRILPLIDENVLEASFDPGNGRPNRSIRLLVGVHVLKAWNDLTDEQVLDNLEFNLQWHYALGITSEEAHFPQKTLHNFRVRLIKSGQGAAMFDRVTKGLVEMDGLSVDRQRMDSTHLLSDIAVLTRLGLFVETVSLFLRELKADQPVKADSLETGVVRRYLEREGYFSDAKRDQAQRRLPVAARDLLYLVRRFERDELVKTWESYQLMVRLMTEQCDITGGEVGGNEQGGEEKIALKDPKQIGGGSLQSPHDPDATYGHKGKGYEAQVVETCVKENPYQVVTHVQINGANESDQQSTVPVVEKLADKGLTPEVLFADTGYGSGENIVACAVESVILIAPVQDPDAPKKTDPRWESAEDGADVCEAAAESAPVEIAAESAPVEIAAESAPAEIAAESAPVEIAAESAPAEIAAESAPAESKPAETLLEPTVLEPLGLDAFHFNATFSKVETCPAGHTPRHQEVLDGNVPYKATFSGDLCKGCPFAGRCPTRAVAKTQDRVLKWRDVTAATATRQHEQQEPAFKEAYKIRSGIESTNMELKGRHGAADLRVRHRPRVALAVTLKAMAMNIKRAVQYHLDQLRETLECTPVKVAEVG